MMKNVNIGVMGHVDSGKTSLCRLLSSVASTAAFDKHPQSQERGITLDLGFSCFYLQKNLSPNGLPVDASEQEETLQVTLVDCPGHASLIRTIIGASQIIDLVLLVVDATKGIQTQTAECLVVSELTCKNLIIVINKVDLLVAEHGLDGYQSVLTKLKSRLAKTMQTTSFSACSIVSVSACPSVTLPPHFGAESILDLLRKELEVPVRKNDGEFIFSVDHCFPLKGKGTVFTGTVLSGALQVGDSIEIPMVGEYKKKVKSLQRFHESVEKGFCGDRLGICVSQFDSKCMERGFLCKSKAVQFIHGCIAQIQPVRFYKSGPILSRAKYHISLGHETVMAQVIFFSGLSTENPVQSKVPIFDFTGEYSFNDSLLSPLETNSAAGLQYGLIQFEKPILCPPSANFIGSKLDMSIHTNSCRLAFHGSILHSFVEKDYCDKLSCLRICKTKHRQGMVDRIVDRYQVIGKGLFKRESDLSSFLGRSVTLSTGETGKIQGGFGKSGKFKVIFSEPLNPTTLLLPSSCSQSTEMDPNASVDSPPSGTKSCIFITLDFKKYLFEPH